MDNLFCTDCRTTYYSAASSAMVARGERCDCGGLLRIADQAEVPVGGPPEQADESGSAPRTPQGRRRFTRD
jgi:hypothetical protein